jgi:hypothetical protein
MYSDRPIAKKKAPATGQRLLVHVGIRITRMHAWYVRLVGISVPPLKDLRVLYRGNGRSAPFHRNNNRHPPTALLFIATQASLMIYVN